VDSDATFTQSVRCTETPCPRVTKPSTASPGTGVQQRASLTQTSETPFTTTPGSPACGLVSCSVRPRVRVPLPSARVSSRVVTGRRRRTAGSTSGESGIRVVGASDLWVKLAKCCTPVPGDPIMGFVTRGAGVSVHRTDCVNAESLRAEPERLIDVEWAPTAKSSFLVAIQVEALDRNRLLSDITRTLSDQHVNILSAGLSTTKDRICKAKFTFETADPTHLDHVLQAVRGVPAVFDVYRISQ